MPIYHVGGSNGISDQGGKNQNEFSDDSAEAEEQIFEFLLQHFQLTAQQARRTLASLIDSGENLMELALELELGDTNAIDQIAHYVP
jgi:hypothetical protein